MRQRGQAVPPINRLLWRLGIKVRPVPFASFGRFFRRSGCPGPLSDSALYFIGKPHSITGLVAIGVGVASMAAIMAASFRWGFRKLELPRWEDYPNP